LMIPGFVVSELGSRTFLIRVVGPGLAQWIPEGTLADPQMAIYKKRPHPDPASDLVLSCDNWGENGDATLIEQTSTAVFAFGLASGSNDAAMVVTLPPGIYTVHASGVGGSTGIGLVEVYLVP